MPIPDPLTAAASAATAAPSEAAVIVVAEHAVVRAGLRALLGATPGLAVVAAVGGLDDAARAAERARADIVLLDAPPAPDAMAAIDALRAVVPRACVLCLGEDARVSACAVRCIPSGAGVAELHAAIAASLDDQCRRCLLRAHCAVGRAVTLSPRERQVAVHVAEGLPSKQIAARLGIGLRTVNTYRESLARKLGSSSPAVITRYVLEQGIALDRSA